MSKVRRFYRIEEISQVTSLTKGDLMDAVERDGLTLCAWVEGQGFGLAGKGNRLLGLFDYQGVIGLSNEMSKRLLVTNKPTSVSKFLVQEPERVAAIVDCRERFAHLERSEFAEHLYLDKVPVTNFWAYSVIEEVGDLEASLPILKQRGEEAQKSGDGVAMISTLFGMWTDRPVKKVGVVPLLVKPEQLRFDIEAIRTHFELDSDSEGVSSLPVSEPSIVFANDLHEVLAKILAAGGNTSTKGVWKTLELEVSAAAGDRRFDHYNVLVDVSSSDILWRDRDRKQDHYLSYNSLGPTLARLRKQLANS